MEERMPGGKSKTVVYPFDEAVNYTNEGGMMMLNNQSNMTKPSISPTMHCNGRIVKFNRHRNTEV